MLNISTSKVPSFEVNRTIFSVAGTKSTSTAESAVPTPATVERTLILLSPFNWSFSAVAVFRSVLCSVTVVVKCPRLSAVSVPSSKLPSLSVSRVTVAPGSVFPATSKLALRVIRAPPTEASVVLAELSSVNVRPIKFAAAASAAVARAIRPVVAASMRAVSLGDTVESSDFRTLRPPLKTVVVPRSTASEFPSPDCTRKARLNVLVFRSCTESLARPMLNATAPPTVLPSISSMSEFCLVRTRRAPFRVDPRMTISSLPVPVLIFVREFVVTLLNETPSAPLLPSIRISPLAVRLVRLIRSSPDLPLIRSKLSVVAFCTLMVSLPARP